MKQAWERFKAMWERYKAEGRPCEVSDTYITDMKRDYREQGMRFLLLFTVAGFIGLFSDIFENPILILRFFLFLLNVALLGILYIHYGHTVRLIFHKAEAWADISRKAQWAGLVDSSPFLRFTMRRSVVLHGAAEVGLVLGFKWLLSIMRLFMERQILCFTFLGVMHMYAVYALGFGAILAVAIYEDISGHGYKYTYIKSAEEYRRSVEEWMEKREESERKARKEEEAKQRAYEEQRQAKWDEYLTRKAESREFAWNMLNGKYCLDFPDELCDAYADKTYGERKLIRLPHFSKIVWECPACEGMEKEYCAKYKNLLDSIRRVEEADESKAEKNNFGAEGERQVNYKLKWWMNSHPGYKAVVADCFSAYSANCIRLAAYDFTKEPQEIDHLLIGPIGIIHIETKDYIGIIRVRTTEYWDRDVRNEGELVPYDSPAFQVRRHEAVLEHIINDTSVPIHSIICLSSPKAILEEVENSEIPVIQLGHLGEYLNKLESECDTHLSPDMVNTLFLKFENAKVRNSKKRAEAERKKAGQ